MAVEISYSANGLVFFKTTFKDPLRRDWRFAYCLQVIARNLCFSSIVSLALFATFKTLILIEFVYERRFMKFVMDWRSKV